MTYNPLIVIYMKLRIFYYLVLLASLNLLVFGQKSASTNEITDVKNNFSNPQTVGYCELMEKPENYLGKFIRLEAVFKNLATLESILYLDCNTKLSAVSVGFDSENFEKISDEVFQKMNSIRTSYANVIVIGKFLGPRKPNSKFNYGHYGWSKYLFEIYTFEKIECVPEK